METWQPLPSLPLSRFILVSLLHWVMPPSAAGFLSFSTHLVQTTHLPFLKSHIPVSTASKGDGLHPGSNPGSTMGLLMRRTNPKPRGSISVSRAEICLVSLLFVKSQQGGRCTVWRAILLSPEQGDPHMGEGRRGTEMDERCHRLMDPHWVTTRPQTDVV